MTQRPASHEDIEPAQPDPGFVRLIERAKEGEREALAELFERFYPRVERQVHRALTTDVRNGRPWLGARFSTADIVQDTFHGVLRDIGTFMGVTEAAFAGYLTMVVRNRIIDSVRHHEADRRDGRRGEPSLHPDEHGSDANDPSERAALSDEYDAYQRALKTLPEREQLLVRARLEGVATLEELTESLGFSSVSTTRRVFLAAKARISVLLERAVQGGESSDE